MLKPVTDLSFAAVGSGIERFAIAARATIRWWRSDSTQAALRQTIHDAFESWGRVVRKTRVPTRHGVLEFFGNQVLIGAIAWTAALIAGSLVRNFLEVRNFRNLWGLTASGSRTLVSAGDYERIVTLTSYSAGLVMLILVRHLILRLIAEFRALRQERAQGARATGPSIHLKMRARPVD